MKRIPSKEKTVFLVILSLFAFVSICLFAYQKYDEVSSDYHIANCHIDPDHLICEKNEPEPADASSMLRHVCTMELRATDLCGGYVYCSKTGEVVKTQKFQDCLDCIAPKSNTSRTMCGLRFPNLRSFIWQ